MILVDARGHRQYARRVARTRAGGQALPDHPVPADALMRLATQEHDEGAVERPHFVGGEGYHQSSEAQQSTCPRHPTWPGRPVWALGWMDSLKIAAAVGSVVKGHTTIESFASNRSSWTMGASVDRRYTGDPSSTG